MDLRYTAEKMSMAIYGMATSPRSIQRRLIDALAALGMLSDKDFPEEARDDWKALRKRTTSTAAVGNEGTLTATISKMDNEEAVEIAEKLTELDALVRMHLN